MHIVPPLINTGVTVNVLVMRVAPGFVVVKVGTEFVPLVVAKPIGSGVRVQLYVVPGALPVKLIVAVRSPWQY